MSDWPDIAGRIDGPRHILPVRVYYEDTDFSGIVYHASFLRWFERGRTDLLRLVGVHHSQLAAPADGSEALAYVIRRMELDWLRPARIDDLLEVITRPVALGGASVTLHQEARRGADIICAANVVAVMITMTGRPHRIPEAIRARFAAVIEAAP